jgi:hypothetical protein
MQKSGTGWLYDQLKGHKEVWLPPVKELHFFDKGFNFQMTERKCARFLWLMSQGIIMDPRDALFFRMSLFGKKAQRQRAVEKKFVSDRDLGNPSLQKSTQLYFPSKASIRWYLGLFKGDDARVTGDITPAYCFLPLDLIKRIATTIAGLRIILLVRNPVDRLWSHLNMRIRRTNVLDGDYLLDEKKIVSLLRDSRSIRWRSYPSEVYKKWSGVFDEEKMKVILFDQLVTKPNEVRSDIASFLGINPDPDLFTLEAGYNRKEGHAKQQMSDSIRNALYQSFEEEIEECKRLFGGDALGWGKDMSPFVDTKDLSAARLSE